MKKHSGLFKPVRTFTAMLLITAFATAAHGQQTQQDSSISFLYNTIKAEPDPVKMEPVVFAMERRAAEDRSGLTEYCKELVAVAYAGLGNAAKAQEWIKRINESNTRGQAVVSVANQLSEAGKVKEAEAILLPAWEDWKSRKEQPSQGGALASHFAVSNDDFAQQYGIILYKKGEYKKALTYLAPADQSNAAHRGGRGEYYALALAGAGETDKAVVVMTQMMVAHPYTSETFKENARKVFRKKYGNDNYFTQVSDSATALEMTKLDKKIAAMAVNEAAPDFEVTDLNGKSVSLSSLRGKTVILDFWATWCQPCVASFPGMQKAVDYYKNDSSVVFMFIHTLERSGRPVEDVRHFLSYKKYRLPVFMDLKNAATGKNEAVSSYKVRGIPAKFVIDKNGLIRYKNSGYVSEDEAIPEIKKMVDALN